jgi:hypothetical protein
MKPSHAVLLAFAIVLAVGSLTIGTGTVAPLSGAAIADVGKPDRWCGAAAFAPRQTEPETYR